MMVCTFFGHRDCYGLEATVLQQAIEELISKGVDTFYVGHQGQFDSMVFGCLTKLKETHPNITCTVVLAYLPNPSDSFRDCSLYPEGLESGPPRFRIEKRNHWMLDRADYCLCYVNYPWGGAYKFSVLAKKRGLTLRNLGSAEL